MKALVGAFNQEKALVGAFSVIVQLVVEPMDSFSLKKRLALVVALAVIMLGWCKASVAGTGEIRSRTLVTRPQFYCLAAAVATTLATLEPWYRWPPAFLTTLSQDTSTPTLRHHWGEISCMGGFYRLL